MDYETFEECTLISWIAFIINFVLLGLIKFDVISVNLGFDVISLGLTFITLIMIILLTNDMEHSVNQIKKR